MGRVLHFVMMRKGDLLCVLYIRQRFGLLEGNLYEYSEILNVLFGAVFRLYVRPHLQLHI